MSTVNWLANVLGFAWLGVLAFVISPPGEPFAEPVQIAGYGLLGLALLARALTRRITAATAALSRPGDGP